MSGRGGGGGGLDAGLKVKVSSVNVNTEWYWSDVYQYNMLNMDHDMQHAVALSASLDKNVSLIVFSRKRKLF